MKKIKLTQNKYALVDDADFEWLNQWRWCAYSKGGNGTKTYYAGSNNGKMNPIITNSKVKWVAMHRLITECPKGMMVDHIDGNGSNNQRKNLRICSMNSNSKNRTLNSNNKSGYKGVIYLKKAKGWRSYIRNNYKYFYGNLKFSKLEAAKEYNKLALKYHGEFARLNIFK